MSLTRKPARQRMPRSRQRSSITRRGMMPLSIIGRNRRCWGRASYSKRPERKYMVQPALYTSCTNTSAVLVATRSMKVRSSSGLAGCEVTSGRESPESKS